MAIFRILGAAPLTPDSTRDNRFYREADEKIACLKEGMAREGLLRHRG